MDHLTVRQYIVKSKNLQQVMSKRRKVIDNAGQNAVAGGHICILLFTKKKFIQCERFIQCDYGYFLLVDARAANFTGIQELFLSSNIIFAPYIYF